MVDLSELVLVFIIVLDFALSLWNAYASGVTWTLLRGQPGQRFAKAAAIAGLGLAFAGMSYAILIVVSFAALFVGVLAITDVLFIVSFDFLVFAAMIIGFGLVVTAQSIAIAYRERKFGAIAVAAWNVFTEIWDITIYVEGFRDAATVVQNEKNRVNLWAIIVAAVGVAFLITFVAYRHGVRRAEGEMGASSQPYSTAGSVSSVSAGSRRSHPRTTAIIGVVVVLIIVAVVVAIVTSPSFGKHVHVTAITVWAPDNVCGYAAHPIGYDGFDGTPGTSQAFALQILNFNSTGCTIVGVTTNTTGFGLSNVQVPVTVPGGLNSTLNLTVVLTSGSFSGVLSLVYS